MSTITKFRLQMRSKTRIKIYILTASAYPEDKKQIVKKLFR